MKNDFHIGSLIRKKVKERKMSMTDFAAAISCSRPNAYSIFQRESIDINLLQTISEVLDHDFVEMFNRSSKTPKDPELCVVVLETNSQKLETLQTDTTVNVVRSWAIVS
jgi:transcriptional regulator with XRE-family HTH domain